MSNESPYNNSHFQNGFWDWFGPSLRVYHRFPNGDQRLFGSWKAWTQSDSCLGGICAQIFRWSSGPLKHSSWC